MSDGHSLPLVARLPRWWEPQPQPVTDMLFDHKGYRVEVRENDRVLSVDAVSEPFACTVVLPQGWRAALAVLLGRYRLEVHVAADQETRERVRELDPEYLGAPGSARRRAWDGHVNSVLGVVTDDLG